jgi:hypothetical protein
MKKIILLLLLATGTVHFSIAQQVGVVTSNKPGWHKIGEAVVDFKADRDAIIVAGADKFKAIRLVVTDAPIRFDDLEVYYENGTKEDIQVRNIFKRGEKTRIIDLKGYNRNLKRVVFVYRSIPNWRGQKAHVELYGLK